MTAAASVLWVAYDGVLSGPGRSQVVPYLEALADRGVRPRLLSWEKPGPRRGAGHGPLRMALRAKGVRWRALPYHHRPTLPATALDLLHGVAAGAGLARGVDLIHARSLLSMLAAGPLARMTGAPRIFDMRGFWAEERVDGGLWPRDGILHRGVARLEARAEREADGLVVLTERAAEILRERGVEAPMRVIPTCVDLARFRPGVTPPTGAEDLAGRRVWLLLGATGTWYLRDAMLDFGRDALVADPDAVLLILSEEHHAEIREGLRLRAIEDRTVLRAVPHEDVPAWIGVATAAVVFIRPAPSKAASCPTKLGEILACGRPVVIGARIGDVDALVDVARVGVVLPDPERDAFSRSRDALDDLLADPGLAARCRRTAEASLSLEGGVEQLMGLYDEVLSRSRRSRSSRVSRGSP